MAFPTKDTLLKPFSTNFEARLVTSGATTYKQLPAVVTQYTTLHDLYVASYDDMIEARAAGDRSASLVASKDLAKTNLLGLGRQVYASILTNEAIAASDKILIGIHLRVAPTPIPVPGAEPGMDVRGVSGRTVSVRVHDAANPARRARPSGCAAAYVYSFVGTEWPADPAAWIFEGATTRNSFDVAFSDSLPAGTQVWLRAAWVNPRLAVGPMCAPVTTVLQYAGAELPGATLKVAA